MQDADSIPGWDLEIRRCFTGKYPSVRSRFTVWGSKSAESCFFCPQVNCLHPCHTYRIRAVNHFSVVGAEHQYRTNKYDLRHSLQHITSCMSTVIVN